MNMGLAVYQQMKKNHYFLTSTQNVPLAVLLGENGKGLQALQKAETCYQLLAANGFKKGQYLHQVSHILALQSEKEPEMLVSACKQIYQSITESVKKQRIIIIQTLLSSHFWKSQISKPFCASLTN